LVHFGMLYLVEETYDVDASDDYLLFDVG